MLFGTTQENNNFELMKMKAQRELSTAVRLGRVNRLPCIVCGEPDSHGHHHDYRKPLDVWWLCAPHHGWQHRYRGSQQFIGQYELVTSEPVEVKPVTWHNSRAVKYLEAAMGDTFLKRRAATLEYAAIAMVAAWGGVR